MNCRTCMIVETTYAAIGEKYEIHEQLPPHVAGYFAADFGGGVSLCQPAVKPEIVGHLYADESTVQVLPVKPQDHRSASINVYSSCSSEPYRYPAIGYSQSLNLKAELTSVIQLDERLKEGQFVCVVEEFYYDSKEDFLDDMPSCKDEEKKKTAQCDYKSQPSTYSVSATVRVEPAAPQPTPGAPAPPRAVHLGQSENSYRTYARLTTGVDVSAAASADPAANFMADLSFDVPFSNLDSSLYNRANANGYIRLASIAQPGQINGIANPATYIKPLTDSTPNNLVQSWEGNVAFAYKLNGNINLGEQNNAYWTTSLIADGGFVSPLSVSQAKPAVYVANQTIYNYYTATPTPSAAAATAITNACGAYTSGTFPTCYLAYVPQDRTRFFRNYAAGVTFKHYRYQGGATLDTDKFDFPGMATIKIGQNEYVTKGQARGFVLHGDIFWPIPNILTGSWAGTLYFFGSVDTHLSRNESAPQFLLPTAQSDITLTSSHVAIIPVQQPDRDRYRFGVAVDLTTLIKAVSSAAGQK